MVGKPMRGVFAVPVLMLTVVMSGLAQADATSPEAVATSDRDAARWAELEAQARVTDGDYDGAIQAQAQADADQHAAAQQEKLARSQKR
jgi:hypothetical protein